MSGRDIQPPKSWRKGDPLTASKLNETTEVVAGLVRTEQSRTGEQRNTDREARGQKLVVKITGHDTEAGFHQFQQQYWDATNKAFADDANGHTHTSLGPAYNLSGVYAAIGSFVTLVKSRVVRYTTGNLAWAFQLGGYEGSSFLAKITGNATLGSTSIRWKYAWTEVELDGDSTSDVSGGRSGTTSTDYAINLAELSNGTEPSASSPWVGGYGVNMHGDDYPSGFQMQPIGASPNNAGAADETHRVNVIVRMWEMLDVNGDTKYVFSASNQHDGVC